MRDVIWTLIVVWVVYRLYNAFSNSGKRTVVYEKHEHHHYSNGQSKNNSNGEIKIESMPPRSPKKKAADDEYTDFEEIK